jgi:hypothetical protein
MRTTWRRNIISSQLTGYALPRILPSSFPFLYVIPRDMQDRRAHGTARVVQQRPRWAGG